MSFNPQDLLRISENAKAEAASRSFAAAKVHASRPVATLNSYIPLQKDYIGIIIVLNTPKKYVAELFVI
jgi:hypothetical protein